MLAHVNIAKLLKAKGDKTGSVEQFEKAIGIDPLFVDAYNEWGNLLLDENEIARAIEMYRKAIEINPNYSLAYNNLGYALQQQGKRDEAVKNYRVALEKDPYYEKTYLNWGDLLYSQRQYEAALRYIGKPPNFLTVAPWAIIIGDIYFSCRIKLMTRSKNLTKLMISMRRICLCMRVGPPP